MLHQAQAKEENNYYKHIWLATHWGWLGRFTLPMVGDLPLSFHTSLPLLIFSILTKTKDNLKMRSYEIFAFSVLM